ncbi:MAG TPA: hypothetical protein VKC59_07285 [Candidatus Limnocylindrales bacterium]|nr:hypothetical protein [Candidatus Limnocylindrales bacterium]
MTLPFRRRHHDDETAHDRARALWSTAMLEPLGEGDSAWLTSHLDGCAECRLEHEAYLADRVLLRALRQVQPDPPRDLWARTSAAIEREAARHARGQNGFQLGDRLVPRQVRLPLGILSGVLVALVVVATSLAPREGPIAAVTNPPGSGVALRSPEVGPSPLVVNPAPVAWVQTGADGTIRVITADVAEVCPSEKSGCAPLQHAAGSALSLGAPPQALIGSPSSDQLIVVSGSKGSHPGSVIVVPVPTPVVEPTRLPVGSSPTPTVVPTPTPSTHATTPPGSQEPTPLPTPVGAHSIAEGVTVVGETRYSADGKWLAFSAQPLDGSTGPDLYVWNGKDATAIPVTIDHTTYFSSWLGDRVLASRVQGETLGPATTPDPASPAPNGVAGSPIIRELHPVSFVFDPATGTSTDLATSDVWLPTVDPTGRFMTYWSGTILRGAGLAGELELGKGQLVLDGWLEPLGGPIRSKDPIASVMPIGPAGTRIELVRGPITGFDTQFDTTGTRLAIWVADAIDSSVGTLRLVILDPVIGGINDRLTPLQSERALKGVSIDEGRLAWVSPPGENGNQSSVRVLAWTHDDFGQIQTLPGEQLAIIR